MSLSPRAAALVVLRMLVAVFNTTRADYANYARTTSVLIPWPPRR
ncbi:hypothetical protein [Ralstonia insidiosa]|nr:hypothetical protein [Ralstonia insidiosa]